MEGEAICQDVKIAAPNSITNRNRDLYVCENGIFKLKTSTGEACGLGYTDFLQNDEPITKDDVDENNKRCCRTQTINGQEVAQCFKLSDENSNECGIYNSNIGAEFFNGEYKLKTENDFKVAKCPYSYQDKPSDCGYFSGEINFYDGNAIVIPVSQAESIVGGATNGLISELTDGLAEGSTDRTVDGAAQEEVGCDIEAFNNNNQYSVTLEGEEVLPFGKKTCDNTMKHIYQCDRTNGMFNLIFCPSDNGKKCIITNNEEGAYCG